ncbi:MAG: hypothetical protein MJ133_03775 [Lachnospiraceae bacterium]|nr:hypothetical protein [Lachnospiraceae bacterium]
MDNEKQIKKLNIFLSSPVYIIISLILSAGLTYLVYYLRIIEGVNYKLANGICLSLLVLCFINFFFVYKDKASAIKGLIKQSIPALFYFIAFFICKMFLRG